MKKKATRTEHGLTVLQERVLLSARWGGHHEPRKEIPHGVYRSMVIKGLIHMPPREYVYLLTPEGLNLTERILRGKPNAAANGARYWALHSRKVRQRPGKP